MRREMIKRKSQPAPSRISCLKGCELNCDMGGFPRQLRLPNVMDVVVLWQHRPEVSDG